MTSNNETIDLAGFAARLRRLEDLEAVRETLLDYCHRLDIGDFMGLGDTFTEDAVVELVGLAGPIDGTYRGRRSIVDDFYTPTGDPQTMQGAMTGHLTTNLQIDLHGDEATTTAYFFEIVDDSLVLIGTYQHRMRREPDRWRIAFLRITIRYRARIETSTVKGRPFPAGLSPDPA